MKFKQNALFISAMVPLFLSAAEPLRVLNWSDYIDEGMLKSFSDMSGVEVEYHTFENEDDFITKYFEADSAWDVIFPSDNLLSFLISKNAL